MICAAFVQKYLILYHDDDDDNDGLCLETIA